MMFQPHAEVYVFLPLARTIQVLRLQYIQQTLFIPPIVSVPLMTKTHAYVSLKRDVKRYALMHGFQDALHRDPPLTTKPSSNFHLQELDVNVWQGLDVNFWQGLDVIFWKGLDVNVDIKSIRRKADRKTAAYDNGRLQVRQRQQLTVIVCTRKINKSTKDGE